MAMGNYNPNLNSNNQQKKYSPSVRSNYSLSNTEAKIENTGVSITFWNGMIKISIIPIEVSDDSFRYIEDKAISIWLTHTKARLLSNEISEFLKDKNSYNNLGVNSGEGLISISNGKELGLTSPCIIIRKIKSDNGEVLSSISYEFKSKYHHSIRNFKEDDSSFDSIYDEDLEILQLKDVLDQYYLSMTNAFAYSIMDSSKYNDSKINTKLDSICEKLGIEYKNQSNKSSNTYFNANANNESKNNDKFDKGDINSINRMMDMDD